MHIEKLSVKDREVTVRLSADEIVKLCKPYRNTWSAADYILT